MILERIDIRNCISTCICVLKGTDFGTQITVQIAKKIGINTKSYNMKENGKIRFSLDEAAKVSEVLKLSLNEVNNIFLQIKLPKGNKFRR